MNSALRLAFFFMIPVLISLFGCKGGKKMEQLMLGYTQSISIPVTIRVNIPHNSTTPPFDTNIFFELERINSNISLVERIDLNQLNLRLKSPTASDLSFISTVNVFLLADDLPETLVAWRENIHENTGSELLLNTTGADLKAYLFKGQIQLRISTVARKLIASEHHIDLDATIKAEVRVLGV